MYLPNIQVVYENMNVACRRFEARDTFRRDKMGRIQIGFDMNWVRLGFGGLGCLYLGR